MSKLIIFEEREVVLPTSSYLTLLSVEIEEEIAEGTYISKTRTEIYERFCGKSPVIISTSKWDIILENIFVSSKSYRTVNSLKYKYRRRLKTYDKEFRH